MCIKLIITLPFYGKSDSSSLFSLSVSSSLRVSLFLKLSSIDAWDYITVSVWTSLRALQASGLFYNDSLLGCLGIVSLTDEIVRMGISG